MSHAIHTDAPLLPLTRMVGDTATIEIGKAAGTTKPDCIEGWAESQSDRRCKPHHILWGMDPHETEWVAKTLIRLGHQVVVTAPTNPADQFGDHEVVGTMPMAYTQTHEH